MPPSACATRVPQPAGPLRYRLQLLGPYGQIVQPRMMSSARSPRLLVLLPMV